MDVVTLGTAGLRGWRATLADAVAPAVARRSPLSEDQVRAAFGALFLALGVRYVVSALADLLRG